MTNRTLNATHIQPTTTTSRLATQTTSAASATATTTTTTTTMSSYYQSYNSNNSNNNNNNYKNNITNNIETKFSWGLTNFWYKIIKLRSRRRSRRIHERMIPNPTTITPTTNPNTPDMHRISSISSPDSYVNNSNANSNYNSEKVKTSRPAIISYSYLSTAIQQTLTKITTTTAGYVAIFLLSLTYCTLCGASPCDTSSWWDPHKDKCIPCTVCKGEMIPLRPCQLHRDTICGSIYDLKIDWVVLAKTEPNWKERRKAEDNDYALGQHLTHSELQEEVMPLDWQTASLFFAVLACLLFFIIAACILIHHMRQWRRMERRLDQDVEELSTKLMAKLAEVQSLEGGTFFIGNADALRIPTTFQPQHVLLPEKTGKHHDRHFIKSIQPGNVYIEENSSKG